MRSVVALFAVVGLSLAVTTAVQAQTTSNLLAGDGLVRARSAKTITGFPAQLRLMGMGWMYDSAIDASETKKDKVEEVWGYQFLAFSPIKNVELDLTVRQHASRVNRADYQARGYSEEKEETGLVGDGLAGLKLHAPLTIPYFDVAVEPIVSIPGANDTTNLNDWSSQSGGVDWGGMGLIDITYLPKTTLYLNGGFIHHANQEAQAFGAGGIEYTPSPNISAFLEGSGAFRLNQQKNISIPNWATNYYVGEEYSVGRLTPGIKANIGQWVSLDLAADIGVTTFGPKWQGILGLSVPSATKVRSKPEKKVKRGVIAGVVGIEGTGHTLEARITFPGSDLPSLSSGKQNGEFSVQAWPGEYTVRFAAEGYQPQEKRFILTSGERIQLDIFMVKEAPPRGTIVGKVMDALTGKALMAAIALPGVEGGKILSDATDGSFSAKLPPGTYTSAVTSETATANYLPEKLSFEVKENAVSNLAVSLVKRGEKITLPRVSLLGTQALVAPESFDLLDKIGRILNEHKGLRLEIGGHVDARRSLKKQLALSGALANSVKDYLVQRLNVEADRLFVNGYGGSLPVASNRTQAGRLQNRRVELLILGEGEKVPQVNVSITAPLTPALNPIPNPTPAPVTNPTPLPTTTPAPTSKPTSTTDAQAAYRAGVEAYFNQEYDTAIANFERALRLDPSNSKARDYLAKARAKAAKVKGK